MYTVYFAHPMSTYNTKREAKCIKQIKNRYPDWTILNPNDPIHHQACKACGGGMEYFALLVNRCDAVVALPFKDGEHGAGVYYEMNAAFQRKKTIYEIDPDEGIIKEVSLYDIRPLSISETRHRNVKKQL